jgi:hypothetical protein
MAHARLAECHPVGIREERLSLVHRMLMLRSWTAFPKRRWIKFGVSAMYLLSPRHTSFLPTSSRRKAHKGFTNIFPGHTWAGILFDNWSCTRPISSSHSPVAQHVSTSTLRQLVLRDVSPSKAAAYYTSRPVTEHGTVL